MSCVMQCTRANNVHIIKPSVFDNRYSLNLRSSRSPDQVTSVLKRSQESQYTRPIVTKEASRYFIYKETKLSNFL